MIKLTNVCLIVRGNRSSSNYNHDSGIQ